MRVVEMGGEMYGRREVAKVERWGEWNGELCIKVDRGGEEWT